MIDQMKPISWLVFQKNGHFYFGRACYFTRKNDHKAEIRAFVDRNKPDRLWEVPFECALYLTKSCADPVKEIDDKLLHYSNELGWKATEWSITI